ncbi:hypothetical protein F5884DRAFT_816327 [Xylogone sp. PMI_703]|nr:hypothetical protein F5884DRAFT_816327 [Xylogone sp. PMI_703]
MHQKWQALFFSCSCMKLLSAFAYLALQYGALAIPAPKKETPHLHGFSIYIARIFPPTLPISYIMYRQPTMVAKLSNALDPDPNESSNHPKHTHHTRASSIPSVTLQPGPPAATAASGVGEKRSMAPHPAESPAKKQSKWTPEEDAVIIELRGSGMKWDDISKRLPGRSAISCRLHYQNYLERRSEWDEDRKNKLARLYERFKPEMWAKIAEEMGVPWRAAEAMHWQLGEVDMAHRAGVVPFSLTTATLEAAPNSLHMSSARGHSHTRSQPTSFQPPGPSSSHYLRTPAHPSNGRGSSGGSPSGRTIAALKESIPRSLPPPSPNDPLTMSPYGIGMPMNRMSRGSQMLPSVAEMTTGISPYSTPAFATMSAPPSSGYSSPGVMFPPSIGYSGPGRDSRRGSSETHSEPRDPDRRR